MQVLQQMLIFVIIMVVGAWARKKNILTPDNQGQITQLVLQVAYPAIILSGVTGDGPHMEGGALLYAFGVVVVMLALLMLAAFLIPRILHYGKAEKGIVNVMVVFTNIGFMGVPMVDAIYGKEALIYMTVLLIPFNTSSIRMVGSMTGPLAMMLLGSFLLDTDWKSLINQKIIAFTILKMLVLPIVVTLILKQFVDNTYLLAVLMAALATPSGNVIPLLANLYNKEGYPVSVQGVAVTTAAAVITMPVVALVTGLG